jgi:peroxiredoxin
MNTATAIATVTVTGTYDRGDEIPDFTLTAATGETVRLSQYRGRTVLIFFTTTWCPYCSAEAPFLEHEIWQRYRSRGLQVLGIQVKENQQLAASFAEHHGWTFPVLVDDDGAVSERFAPDKEGLPPEVAVINAHFIVDTDGTVVYRDFLNMERFDARATHVSGVLDQLLGDKS